MDRLRPTTVFIAGQPARVSFDNDLGLYRGEFLALSGGADFYAPTTEQLPEEGRASLKLYLEVCQTKGVTPYAPHTLEELIKDEDPRVVEGASRKATALLRVEDIVRAAGREREVLPHAALAAEVPVIVDESGASMIPVEAFFRSRDSDRWRHWREATVRDVTLATELLAAAFRQQLHLFSPPLWQEVIAICHDAILGTQADDATQWSAIMATLGEIDLGRLANVALAQRALEEDAEAAHDAFRTLDDDTWASAASAESPVWALVREQRLLVGLADGRWVSCPLTWFPRLAGARLTERHALELSYLGIHWPAVDEDISTEGLLAGRGDLTAASGLRQAFLEAPHATVVETRQLQGRVCLSLSDGRCLGLPLSFCTLHGEGYRQLAPEARTDRR